MKKNLNIRITIFTVIAIVFAVGAVYSLVNFFSSLKYFNVSSIGFYIGQVLLAAVLLILAIVMLILMFFSKRLRDKAELYTSVIGASSSMSLDSIATKTGKSYSDVCADLNELIRKHIIDGKVDKESRYFLRRGAQSPKQEKNPNDFGVAVGQIGYTKTQIKNKNIVEKIDRVEQLLEALMLASGDNPAECKEVERFLRQYLPPTAKMVDAYHLYESQPAKSANLTSAMHDIELMLDKIIDCFEKEVDNLFADDALDISTDMDVLNALLERDGFSDKYKM